MLPARIVHTAALVFLTITGLATATQATTPPSFTLHLSQYLTVGTQPLSAATGDFNHDGFQDIVVANHGSASVSVLLGKGDGTFHTPVNYTVPAGPYGVTVGDFNGDGFLDIAVTSTSAKNVTILLGNGDGTFKTPGKSFSTGGESFAIAAGDVSGDRKLDLVVANYDTGMVGVLLGNGDGTFQTVTTVAAGSNARALALADLNGDGKLDLAVANEFEGTVTILLGNGDGTFNVGFAYPLLGLGASSIAVGDFYGNGYADLLVVNDAATGGDIELLPNNGSGGFGTAVSLGAAGGTVPISVVAADFNGDNTWDAAFALKGSNTLGWLAGDGNGTFTSEATAATASGPFFLATADFNGDGIADVVVVNSSANSIYVFTAIPSAPGDAPSVWLSATELAFGNQLADSASRNRVVQLRYTGRGPLPINSITASGEFNQKNDCGTTLAAGASCTIEVLTTSAEGNNIGTLSVNYFSARNASVFLTSAGIPQILSFAPTALDFPVQTMNTASAPQPVTITNHGSDGVFFRVTSTSASFDQTNTCGGYVQGGSTCTILVSFKPVTYSGITGTLSISNSASPAPSTVDLAGTGTYLVVSPNPLTITAEYGSSATSNVTLTNVSTTKSAPISAVTATSGFSATSACGSSLGPGKTCQIAVTYSATALAGSSGTLSVTTGADGGGAQVSALVGNTTPAVPTTTLTVTPSSMPAGSVTTLLANVVDENGKPITLGTVTFIDGSRTLGTVQMVRTSSGGFAPGTATLKTGSFRIGTHSLTARYNPTAGLVASTSPAKTLVVSASGSPVASVSLLTATGTPGSYMLTGSVTTAGSSLPSGSISIVDQSLGNQQVASSAISASSFVPSLLFSSPPTVPVSIVAGDFNGDGILDVAAINYTDPNSPGYVYVALGKGDGTFNEAVAYPVEKGPNTVVAADFDGDGRLDLAVSNFGSVSVSFLYGNGDGTFKSQVPVSLDHAVHAPLGIVIGDFENHGLVDLVATNETGEELPILAWQASGGMAGSSGIDLGCTSPPSMVAGNFATGKSTEVAVSCTGGLNAVYIAYDDGPYFALTLPILSNPPIGLVMAAGDFNLDGNVDIIANNMVLQGIGNNTFGGYTYQAPAVISNIGVIDFLGDGVPGIAVTGGGVLTLYKGYGNYLLEPTTTYNSADVGAMAIGDFNNDGTPDIAFGYTGRVALGQLQAQLSVPNFGVAGTGTHNIIAKYSGDSHYAASQSSALALTEGVPNFGAYSINYGTITHGTQRILNVRLYNASSSSITFALGFSPTSSPFAIATGTSCGTSLPASGSCTVQISFTPPTAGAYNATLSATGSSGSASIALTGNAN